MTSLNTDPTTQYILDLIATKVSIDGDTMTGLLVLSGNPTANLDAATKQYVDGLITTLTDLLAGKVNRSGDTMTGQLELEANPIADLDAASKIYVDGLIATISALITGKLSLTGGTMLGSLILHADPAAALEAATKQYVDAAKAAAQDASVPLAGGSMSGYLGLVADPTTNLQAATKHYVDVTAGAAGGWGTSFAALGILPDGSDCGPAISALTGGLYFIPKGRYYVAPKGAGIGGIVQSITKHLMYWCEPGVEFYTAATGSYTGMDGNFWTVNIDPAGPTNQSNVPCNIVIVGNGMKINGQFVMVSTVVPFRTTYLPPVGLNGTASNTDLLAFHGDWFTQQTFTGALSAGVLTVSAIGANVLQAGSILSGGSFTLANCGVTQDSITITASDTSRLALDQGVTGTGIPPLATIVAIVANTSFDISAPALATGTITATFSGVPSGAFIDRQLTGTTGGIGTYAIGGLGAWRPIPDCTTTNGSAVVTTANTINLVTGQGIVGLGIPTGATIQSISAGVSITLTANATASGNVPLNALAPVSQAVVTSATITAKNYKNGFDNVVVDNVTFYSGDNWQTAGGDSQFYGGPGTNQYALTNCTHIGARDTAYYGSSGTGGIVGGRHYISKARVYNSFGGLSLKRSIIGAVMDSNYFENVIRCHDLSLITGTGIQDITVSNSTAKFCEMFLRLDRTSTAIDATGNKHNFSGCVGSNGLPLSVYGAPAFIEFNQASNNYVYNNHMLDYNPVVGVLSLPGCVTTNSSATLDTSLAGSIPRYSTISGSGIPANTTVLATPAKVSLASCGTTNGSAVVTIASTANVRVGQSITGAGIPIYAVVNSIVANTSFTMSLNATATATVTLTGSPIFVTMSQAATASATVTLTCTATYSGISTMFARYATAGSFFNSVSRAMCYNMQNPAIELAGDGYNTYSGLQMMGTYVLATATIQATSFQTAVSAPTGIPVQSFGTPTAFALGTAAAPSIYPTGSATDGVYLALGGGGLASGGVGIAAWSTNLWATTLGRARGVTNNTSINRNIPAYSDYEQSGSGSSSAKSRALSSNLQWGQEQTIKDSAGTAGTYNITVTAGAITVAACTTTNGSAVVTTVNTGSLTTGMKVEGTGIPASTTISSISAGVSFTMNNNATAANTLSLYVGRTSAVGPLSIASCTTANGSQLVATANTSTLTVGMIVTGTGIPIGATVQSIIANTSFTMTVAATASGSITATAYNAMTIDGALFCVISTNYGAATFIRSAVNSIDIVSVK